MKVLTQAYEIVDSKWHRVGKGWKVLLGILIVLGSLLGVVYLFLRLCVGLLKSISIGGYRNKALYVPSVGRRRR